MNREEMLGPAVSPETGEAYEPGTGYKGVSIGAGLVGLLALKLLFGAIGGEDDGSAASDLPSQIAQGVAEARGRLPVRVDEITTLTGISAVGTRVLYEIQVAADIPTDGIAAARVEQQAELERIACVEPESRRMIDAGATLAYRYTDQTGDRFETEVRSCRLG